MTEQTNFTSAEFTIEAPALDAVKHPAVRGVTFDQGAGVVGVNHATGGRGLLGGRDRVFRQHVGVYGESDQQGVFGHSTSGAGTGVYGNSVGAGFGVRGDSTEGVAVQGQSFGNGLAGKFIGNVEVTGSLVVQGADVAVLIQRIQQLELRLSQATQANNAAQQLAKQAEQRANAVQQSLDQALPQLGLKMKALEQAILNLQAVAHSH
jgi:hypothetical protein